MLHLWGAHGCLLTPEAGHTGQTETVWLALVHNPAWAMWLLQHHLTHITANHWSEGCHDWVKSLAERHCGSSNPKQHLSREGVAITDDCTNGTSGADSLGRSRISDHNQTATACTWIIAEGPHLPLLLQSFSHLGWGCWHREGKNTHLKRTEPAQTQTSEILLQQLEIWPYPWQGIDGHWAEGMPCLTPGSGPITSISSPAYYECDIC